MIFLQILLIISTLFANISCTTLEQLEEKFINLQQKNSQLETTVNLLKNTVDENQATIQVLKEEVKDLKNELNFTKIDTGDKFEDLNQVNENIQTEVATINSQIQDLGGLHVFCFTSVGSWIIIIISTDKKTTTI